MRQRANGTFEINRRDEETYEEHEETKLTRTSLTKTYHGDIEGESTAELLAAYGSEERSAAYVGFERFTGRIEKESGSFVLHHNASSSGSEQAASWSVVPDSATGGLLGLRGEAEISIGPDGEHSFTLNYDFGDERK